MEEKKDGKIDKVEKAQKVAEVVDNVVLKADNMLGSMKTKAGSAGSKIQVALVIIVIVAALQNPGIIWIALGVGIVLFLTPILKMVKNQMKAKEEPKTQAKIELKEDTKK